MRIENIANTDVATLLRSLSEPELIAQELVQKGAMDVLTRLLRGDLGTISEHTVRATLESIQRLGAQVSAECLRRRLPIVEQPGAH